MTYLQGVDVFLAMCLMVVYIDVSMASPCRNKADEKTDQMSVTFNKLYLIGFSQQYLNRFSDCLCSPDTESCRFSYYHDGIRESVRHATEPPVRTTNFPVVTTTTDKVSPVEKSNGTNTNASDSNLPKFNEKGRAHFVGLATVLVVMATIVIVLVLYRRRKQRARENPRGKLVSGTDTQPPSYSGAEDVDYSQVLDTVPSSHGECGISSPAYRGTVSSTHGECSIRSPAYPGTVSSTHGECSIRSPAYRGTVSSTHGECGISSPAYPGTVSSTHGECGISSPAYPGTVSSTHGECGISSPAYPGTVSSTHGECSIRSPAYRGTVSSTHGECSIRSPAYRGTVSSTHGECSISSPAYPGTVSSSHGECGISSPAYPGTVSSTHGEGGISSPAYPGTVSSSHGECGISSTAYPDDTVYTGSVFSIITDGHVTSPIFATTSTSEYSDVSEVRQALSAKEEIPQSVGRVGVNNSTSEPGEGDIRSGEKVIKTVVGAYSKVTKRALRPKKEQNKERSENNYIYSTLSLRRAYPSDEERRSVLNTYNMASEVFKQDLGHPATENEDAVQFGDLYSVIQPIHSIHTDLNTKLGKGGSHEHASCECTPHDFDELRAHADYFILEDDVDGDEDAAYSSSSGSASGIHVTADLEVVEHEAYRAIYEADTSQSNVDSDIERSDNLVLENFMRSDSQQLLIDRSHSVSDAGFQETEYFELEENADLFDGDVQLGEEGHNEDFNHCHDERDPYSEIDVSHVYREKASNWEKN
ncbi:hypothetical protein RRG08_011103 [Elysia crispata]|uniref:Uncharacterized protein n=1 Tax=Elysia crispata TaxID=231223 RepID=A0AAE1A186_9GAST|nr:hypothetical protein RRG08_011103 [Elysia crispata]